MKFPRIYADNVGVTLLEVTVSLHGTLESFALPDVLTLISSTRKSGELRVAGDRVTGRLWLLEGKFTGFDVPKAASLVDGVFELLRLTDGEFDFAADKQAPDSLPEESVEPVLAEAQARLAIWREIELVIPSVSCGLSLVEDSPNESVILRGDQWKLLVIVSNARSVQAVVQHTGAGEFATCQALKELVEVGLVEVGAPVVKQAPAKATAPEEAEIPVPAAAKPVEEPEVEASVVAAPEPEPAPTPAPAPAVAAAPATPAAAKPKLAPAGSSPAPAPAAPAAPARPVSLSSLIDSSRSPSAPTPPPSAVAAAGDADPDADAPVPAAPPSGDGEEEVNRGLLLKFLSSVRS